VLSPYIALAATAVVVMLLSAFYHPAPASGRGDGRRAGGGLRLRAGSRRHQRPAATALLRVNDLSLYFAGLLVVIALVVVALSYGYLARTSAGWETSTLWWSSATLGGVVLLASAHFASFFLGLEVLSVSLYGLIAYPRRRPEAVEAAFKYLVLAGTTSAFLAVRHGHGICRHRHDAAERAADGRERPGRLADGGLSRRTGAHLAGVGFKLALVPFHFWTPDVYQGGPAPVTAFLATRIQGGGLRGAHPVLGGTRPASRRGSGRGVHPSSALRLHAWRPLTASLSSSNEPQNGCSAYSSIAQTRYLTVALIGFAARRRVRWGGVHISRCTRSPC